MNCSVKARKKELAISMVAAVSLLRAQIAAQSGDGSLRSFASVGERFSVGGQKLWIRKQGADHWSHALVECGDGAEGLLQVLLRGGFSGCLLESVQGNQHLRQAFFEDSQQELKAAFEVDVERRLRAACFGSNGPGGYAPEALGAD
jgi:hypothetical protein